jgi:ubiquinone/menaquinone biosynthesis C-methylase UbiE
MDSFSDFAQKHIALISKAKGVETLQKQSSVQIPEDDYDKIRNSFSREWNLFDYDADKTWGWTLDDRKRIFLEDVGLGADQLKGKLLLDAGCGNGTLTAAISTFGLNAVGIDLNDGLGKANLNKSKYTNGNAVNVQYVQGNLFHPPFKERSFDLIYSSGVIHHTPESKATFQKLVPLVKEGGRVYVWVYSRRTAMVRAFFDAGRELKRVLSPEGLLTFCRVFAPFYKFGTELADAFGIAEFRKRSLREITLDLFDAFAPQYNHRHTENEVQGWFRENGFKNITVSGKQKHGFGVYGDKPL